MNQSGLLSYVPGTPLLRRPESGGNCKQGGFEYNHRKHSTCALTPTLVFVFFIEKARVHDLENYAAVSHIVFLGNNRYVLDVKLSQQGPTMNTDCIDIVSLTREHQLRQHNHLFEENRPKWCSSNKRIYRYTATYSQELQPR